MPSAVLAISGGSDSRALLEAWAYARRGSVPSARQWTRIPTTVVVVDHQQRPGSAAEADAVVARAADLGISGQVATIDPPRGDEATLRRLRYAALRQVAADVGAAAIVVAHHRGDVAEGVLMHLAGQGGGRRGRAPKRVEPNFGGDGVALVRPFLNLDKGTLQSALSALGITDVVVDTDDVAGKNARARLRRDLLDPLRQLRPEIEAALAHHAQLLGEDDDVIEAMVPTSPEVSASLPPAILRRWLRRQIAALVEDPRTAAAAIDDAVRLAAAGTPGAVSVRGGVVQIRKSDEGCLVAVISHAGQSLTLDTKP